MTFTSFDSFINRARQNVEGTVRIAKGDESNSHLINSRGTFGHSVATFFKSIGSLFGYKDPSRLERNQTALTEFKKALTEQFGETVALKAWGDKRLDEMGKLTGKTIFEVSNHALSLTLQNRDHNDDMYRDCLPINFRRTDYPGGKFFAEICKGVGYDLDVAKTLTPERYQAYRERLDIAFNGATLFDSVALTPDKAKEIAQDVLKQVMKLDLGGGLEGAQKARQAFTDSVSTLVTDIAGGRSPRRVLESLVAMNKCLEQVLQREGIDDPARTRDLKKALYLEAMSQISTLDPKLLRKCQDKIFGDDSSLRALHNQLNEYGQNGALSDYGVKHIFDLQKDVGELVEMLARSIGTHTDSQEKDGLLLDDQKGVGGSVQTRALQEVQTYFSGLLQDHVRGPESLLGELKVHIGKFDGNDFPTWHSTEVLTRLEEEVKRYSDQMSLPIGATCRQFHEAIDADPDLPEGLKDKLKSGLVAMESREAFNERLSQNREFEGLGSNNSWRLFMNGDNSPWELEQYNQGSLSGLYRSFTAMLETRGENLTGRYIEHLHDVGCENSFAPGLGDSFKRGVFEDAIDVLKIGAMTPQGFRQGTTNLNLDPGTVTPEGLQALEDDQGRLGYTLDVDRLRNKIVLSFHEQTPESCEERANQILGTYQTEIGQARTDDEKLQAIGRAVQDLYRSHLFTDGNTRTMVVNLMNRMLLDNDLSPSILDDPKVTTTCSLPQFVQHIKDGQKTFEMMTG